MSETARTDSAWEVGTMSVYAKAEDLWIARASRLAGLCREMEGALREIAKGEGAFSRDQLEHATNCIESMKRLAVNALTVSGD